MKQAHSTDQGLDATDVANRYLTGEISYENAQFLLREGCGMGKQQAKDFLRNAVEGE